VCPHSGIAPWARREGPSLAQRGYLGIHAEVPTAQRLRSASVVNGASKIKIQSKIQSKSKSKSKSKSRARAGCIPTKPTNDA
jgi:hypothetical protein